MHCARRRVTTAPRWPPRPAYSSRRHLPTASEVFGESPEPTRMAVHGCREGQGAGRTVSGSVVSPSTYTSKGRWHALDVPAVPGTFRGPSTETRHASLRIHPCPRGVASLPVVSQLGAGEVWRRVPAGQHGAPSGIRNRPNGATCIRALVAQVADLRKRWELLERLATTSPVVSPWGTPVGTSDDLLAISVASRRVVCEPGLDRGVVVDV